MLVPDLVVVGSPSTDTLLIGDELREIVGGAAFITALAARAAGARVGLLGAVPPDLPESVCRAFAPGRLDPGGLVLRDGVLPAFRIDYQGEIARYTGVQQGVELQISAADLPQRWRAVPAIHLSPLGGSAAAQLRFARELRERWSGSLSIGTFLRAGRQERETLEELLAFADRLFLNQEEFEALFPQGPPPDLEVFVTCGSEGVRVHHQGKVAAHSAPPAEVLDPTGAGDAFCGGLLGGDLQQGLELARRVLSGWGAEPLLEGPPPPAPLQMEYVGGEPAPLDQQRIERLGEALRAVASSAALDFCGFPFPEADDPDAAEVLALSTLHQYGFWTADERWIGPMYASAGRRWKGSDFIWQAFTRAGRQDPVALRDPLLFDRICLDDGGVCPVPDLSSHRSLQQGYGAWLEEKGPLPLDRGSTALLDVLRLVPGYGEDPMAKKSRLLCLILARRGLLELDAPLGPIVDYHVMRGCLRTGCVVPEAAGRAVLEGRVPADATLEASIRLASQTAIEGLCEASGLTVAEIDGFFFANGRRLCHETREPECETCPIEHACGREARLFQPVFRTTAY